MCSLDVYILGEGEKGWIQREATLISFWDVVCKLRQPQVPQLPDQKISGVCTAKQKFLQQRKQLFGVLEQHGSIAEVSQCQKCLCAEPALLLQGKVPLGEINKDQTHSWSVKELTHCTSGQCRISVPRGCTASVPSVQEALTFFETSSMERISVIIHCEKE